MTPDEFVALLRDIVQARAVDSTLSAIEKPPGRRPKPELVETSAWYAKLSIQDRERLRSVASLVARQAVFGVLAVLDGARVIDDGREKGTFKLSYRKGGEEWDLNPADGVPLHDLLAE